MTHIKVNSSPQRFQGIEAFLLFIFVGITAGGVYVIQQHRINRLQAANQVLQQQVVSLQTDNASQQQMIEGLNTTKSKLIADLHLVCQQRQTVVGNLAEGILGRLLEHDFAEQWKRLCEKQPAEVGQVPPMGVG